MKKKPTKYILSILFISLGIISFYILALCFLKKSSGLNNLNEFGDYIGGVLNPLFTLLSTFSIIFLTYIIAKNESSKAQDGIDTQKRITLNQMRQEALNNITDKLNMFGYQLDKLSLHDLKQGSFVQRVLTKQIEDKENEETFIWLIIILELENFSELNYLFKNLFEREDFKNTYSLVSEATSKLSEEQKEMKMITSKSLENYIEAKQEFVAQIGNFIISEF